MAATPSRGRASANKSARSRKLLSAPAKETCRRARGPIPFESVPAPWWGETHSLAPRIVVLILLRMKRYLLPRARELKYNEGLVGFEHHGDRFSIGNAQRTPPRDSVLQQFRLLCRPEDRHVKRLNRRISEA